MKLFRIWPVILLVTGSFLFGEVLGDRRICALRVAFQPDDSPGSTGDGRFLTGTFTDSCGRYTIDPPPHDRRYFESQLKAVDHYFRSVSYGKFGLDLNASRVFPENDTASYHLAHPMSWYHPYGQDALFEARLTELFSQAVHNAYAADSIDFSGFDLVVVFHAGIGQDFSLPFLDPTPEDIPSTYVDRRMIQTHLGPQGIVVGGQQIEHGIILPETQNHLLYDIGQELFNSTGEPCDYQFGLTGTLALMLGFAVGLPPLWDLETGQSGIGIFGLMDQGSNNGRGLIPAPPEAWTRIFAGWEVPVVTNPPAQVSLPSREQGRILRVAMDDDEYFLIEHRSNWIRDSVSIDSLRWRMYLESQTGPTANPRYPPLVEVLLDSVPVERDPNGVLTAIPDYDLGLPGTGLLIWHCDDRIIRAGMDNYTINAQRQARGIDLEEADGARDIGYPSIFLISDPSRGYFGDLWFRGNPEYERANPHRKGLAPRFGPATYPDTRTNSGLATWLTVDNISFPAENMTFTIEQAYLAQGFPDTTLGLQLLGDIDGDGSPELLGAGDSLWWSREDTLHKVNFFPLAANTSQLILTGESAGAPAIILLSAAADSLRVHAFRYDSGPAVVESTWKWTFPASGWDHAHGYHDREAIRILKYPNYWIVSRDTVLSGTLPDAVPPAGELLTMVNTAVSADTLQAYADSGGEVLIRDSQGRTLGNILGKGVTLLAAADLDLDGHPEVIAAGESGDLLACSRNGTSLPGFPVAVGAITTILVRNCLDDSHPEIVVQTGDGDIRMFNWQGEQKYHLANPQANRLRMLGDFRGRAALVTEWSVWQFAEAVSTIGNEWALPNSNPRHDRNLVFSITPPESNPELLIDKSRTYAYPNPARDSQVTLRIQVETAETVKIRIYDLTGFHVTDLTLDSPVPHLANEVTWDISAVAAGIYFLNVEAGRGSKFDSKIIKLGVIR